MSRLGSIAKEEEGEEVEMVEEGVEEEEGEEEEEETGRVCVIWCIGAVLIGLSCNLGQKRRQNYEDSGRPDKQQKKETEIMDE